MSHDPSSACITISGTDSASFHAAPWNASARCVARASSSRMRTSEPVNTAGDAAHSEAAVTESLRSPVNAAPASLHSASWSTAPAPTSTMRGAV